MARAFSVTAVLGIIGAVLVTQLAITPLDPEPWKNSPPSPELHGPLASNELLIATEILHEHVVIAPEAFEAGAEGTLYTGLANGCVVALTETGEQPKAVFFTGGFLETRTGNGLAAKQLVTHCHDLAQQGVGKIGEANERKCGRPLGLEYDSSTSTLYILDAYHGLFTLNTESGSAQHLLNAATVTPKSALALPSTDDQRPLRFLNDLTLAPDGSIYFTDSSWKHSRAHNRVSNACICPSTVLKVNCSADQTWHSQTSAPLWRTLANCTARRLLESHLTILLYAIYYLLVCRLRS
jgi:hypothetical protein